MRCSKPPTCTSFRIAPSAPCQPSPTITQLAVLQHQPALAVPAHTDAAQRHAHGAAGTNTIQSAPQWRLEVQAQDCTLGQSAVSMCSGGPAQPMCLQRVNRKQNATQCVNPWKSHASLHCALHSTACRLKVQSHLLGETRVAKAREACGEHRSACAAQRQKPTIPHSPTLQNNSVYVRQAGGASATAAPAAAACATAARQSSAPRHHRTSNAPDLPQGHTLQFLLRQCAKPAPQERVTSAASARASPLARRPVKRTWATQNANSLPQG